MRTYFCHCGNCFPIALYIIFPIFFTYCLPLQVWHFSIVIIFYSFLFLIWVSVFLVSFILLRFSSQKTLSKGWFYWVLYSYLAVFFLFLFSTLKIPSYPLLTCKISAEKYAVHVMRILFYPTSWLYLAIFTILF